MTRRFLCEEYVLDRAIEDKTGPLESQLGILNMALCRNTERIQRQLKFQLGIIKRKTLFLFHAFALLVFYTFFKAFHAKEGGSATST